MKILDVGCGTGKQEGAIGLDNNPRTGADVIHDLGDVPYPFADKEFDLIVSNPPYVPEHDRAQLQPEVRDYEPSRALFAGDDGLLVIRRLIDQVPGRLKPEGRLIFEFGFGQADGIRTLLSNTRSMVLLDLRRDLQGIPRVAIASAN